MSINVSSNNESVTRFGGISPLWQKFEYFGQFVKDLFGIGQNFVHNLANF